MKKLTWRLRIMAGIAMRSDEEFMTERNEPVPVTARILFP
jgi:hypothetical protein